MFETMRSFLAFFIPCVILIILGILFEEKLIAWEDKHIIDPILARIDEFKEWRCRRAKMQRLRRRNHLSRLPKRETNSL